MRLKVKTFLITIVILLIGSVSVNGCTYLSNNKNATNAVKTNKGAETDSDNNSSDKDSVNSANISSGNEDAQYETATSLVNSIHLGWNLGNSLNAWDSTNQASFESGEQFKDTYQAMATYETSPYTAWDASDCLYFDSKTGVCNLNWKIDSLNSSSDQKCGSFSFQLINHSIGTSKEKVTISVSQACLITADGEKIGLDDIGDSYELNFIDSSTEHVKIDISSLEQLRTTQDLLGGTLKLEIKIDKYITIPIENMSKEAYYETLWGNPATTKEMIDKIKEAGFDSVRIPITYYNHLDENGVIDEAWLQRIKEVVDYVVDNNMVCIINLHYDAGAEGWLRAGGTNYPENKALFEKIWNQVGTYFKDYDSRLLFEGINELVDEQNNWESTSEEAYILANELNQSFVDTVRNTGGYNAYRCLLLTTYAASAKEVNLSHFTLPKDTIKDALIAEVHYYQTDESQTDTLISLLDKYFVSRDIPVIIGEFGTTFDMKESDRITKETYLVKKAKEIGIPCLRWDDGNYKNIAGAQCKYALLDRASLTWYHEDLMKALVEAVNEE